MPAAPAGERAPKGPVVALAAKPSGRLEGNVPAAGASGAVAVAKVVGLVARPPGAADVVVASRGRAILDAGHGEVDPRRMAANMAKGKSSAHGYVIYFFCYTCALYWGSHARDTI